VASTDFGIAYLAMADIGREQNPEPFRSWIHQKFISLVTHSGIELFDELNKLTCEKMTDRFYVRRRSFKSYIIEIIEIKVKQTSKALL